MVLALIRVGQGDASRRRQPMTDQVQTTSFDAARLAQKIRWEGGVMATLDYGHPC